jgi:hypothetical protein
LDPSSFSDEVFAMIDQEAHLPSWAIQTSHRQIGLT